MYCQSISNLGNYFCSFVSGGGLVELNKKSEEVICVGLKSSDPVGREPWFKSRFWCFLGDLFHLLEPQFLHV